MSSFKMYGAAILAIFLLTLGGAAVAAEKAKEAKIEIVDSGWTQRCSEASKEKVKTCEIFENLEIKGVKTVLAQFTVGFPEDKNLKKGAARGVVILPLGILLDRPMEMHVDEGKPTTFKMRYCTNIGCFSYMDIDKDLLFSMKKGKAIKLSFTKKEGNQINFVLSLAGFEKALKAIEP